MHGIFDGPQQFQNLSSFIKKVGPRTAISAAEQQGSKTALFTTGIKSGVLFVLVVMSLLCSVLCKLVNDICTKTHGFVNVRY